MNRPLLQFILRVLAVVIHAYMVHEHESVTAFQKQPCDLDVATKCGYAGNPDTEHESTLQETSYLRAPSDLLLL